MLPNAIFPVLLRPHWSEQELRQRHGPPPLLELLVRTKVSAARVSYYEAVSVRLQTLELKFDTRKFLTHKPASAHLSHHTPPLVTLPHLKKKNASPTSQDCNPF